MGRQKDPKRLKLKPLGFNIVDTTSSCSGHQGALLGFKIPGHETTCGWATESNPSYPQNVVLELIRPGSHVCEIRILCHEHWIPATIDIIAHHNIETKFAKDDRRSTYFGTVAFKSLKQKHGDRLREQKVVEINASNVDRLCFMIKEPHGEPATNPENKVGVIQIILVGYPNKKSRNRRARIHTYLETKAGNRGRVKSPFNHQDPVDHELHSLGLTTIAEMGTSSGAIQAELKHMGIMEHCIDQSTAAVLDMLRIQKSRAVEQVNIGNASRFALLFTVFDRISILLQDSIYGKNKSAKHEHFGLAIEAKERMEVALCNRNILVDRETLRSWCCGGQNSADYESIVESQLQTGIIFGTGDDNQGVCASVQQLHACNFSDLPVNLRSFESSRYSIDSTLTGTLNNPTLDPTMYAVEFPSGPMGLTLRSSLENHSECIVTKVLDGGVASEAGVQVNDILLLVSNDEVSQLDNHAIAELILTSQRPVRLTFKRLKNMSQTLPDSRPAIQAESENVKKEIFITGNELNRYCRSLLGQFFGVEGREYEMGTKSPEQLTGKSMHEEAYVRVFGEYFTRCVFSKVWILRQVAPAVLLTIVNGNVDFLKSFIKYHQLDPGGFFFLATELMLELIHDRVALVFEQVSETIEGLFSILWTDERHQRKRSFTVVYRLCKKLSQANNTKVMKDALDLIMFFASKDFCGPAFVSDIVVKELYKILKSRTSASSILGLLSAYEMMLEEFGLVTDELVPPGEDQVVTILQGCRLSLELMKCRHNEVREAGVDLATHLYAMDQSLGSDASRSILRYDSFFCCNPEWLELLITRFHACDVELKRLLHADDEKYISQTAFSRDNDDESNQIKQLKFEIEEMKKLQRDLVLKKGIRVHQHGMKREGPESKVKLAPDANLESESRGNDVEKKESYNNEIESVTQRTQLSSDDETKCLNMYNHFIESSNNGIMSGATLQQGFGQLGVDITIEKVIALLNYFEKHAVPEKIISYHMFRYSTINQRFFCDEKSESNPIAEKASHEQCEVKLPKSAQLEEPQSSTQVHDRELPVILRKELPANTPQNPPLSPNLTASGEVVIGNGEIEDGKLHDEHVRLRNKDDLEKIKHEYEVKHEKDLENKKKEVEQLHRKATAAVKAIEKKQQKVRKRFFRLLNRSLEANESLQPQDFERLIKKMQKHDERAKLPQVNEIGRVIRVVLGGQTTPDSFFEKLILYSKLNNVERDEFAKYSDLHLRYCKLLEVCLVYIGEWEKDHLDNEKTESGSASKSLAETRENEQAISSLGEHREQRRKSARTLKVVANVVVKKKHADKGCLIN